MESASGENISEAEKRRLRRRQNILNNSAGRIQRIVNDSDTVYEEKNGNKEKNGKEKNVNKEKERKDVKKYNAYTDTDYTAASSGDTIRESFKDSTASTTTYVNKEIQEDREEYTVHPKIPAWVGRGFVMFLGVILSAFNGKYYMVTFFSWEVAFLGINGLPASQQPPGIFIAVVALVGLREPYLHRLRFITQLLNTLITDLSLFVIAVLLPRVILKM